MQEVIRQDQLDDLEFAADVPVLNWDHPELEQPEKAIVIVSGGMDSVTLLYDVIDHGYEPHVLSFDYGQRHRKELVYASHITSALGLVHNVVDLHSVTGLLKGSALTDPSVKVPHGHYAADNMAITVVPNRNAMMLSIAYAVAVAEGAAMVAAGFHAGDHAQYPDCRPKFVRRFYRMERTACEGFINSHLRLYTPFLEVGKHDIVTRGATLSVPYELTWSCYEGGEQHCGRCATCVERAEAFALAGVPDPTVYADTEYWKTVVKAYKGS